MDGRQHPIVMLNREGRERIKTSPHISFVMRNQFLPKEIHSRRPEALLARLNKRSPLLIAGGSEGETDTRRNKKSRRRLA